MSDFEVQCCVNYFRLTYFEGKYLNRTYNIVFQNIPQGEDRTVMQSGRA